MLETLSKHIKTNIAQYTQLFDIFTQNVQVTTQSNRIFNVDLDGEYTLSGGTDGVASAGCLNDTFTFENNEVVTNCYYGDDETIHDMVAHKVNVGMAISEAIAEEMIVDEKTGNSIIVYLSDTRAETTDEKYTISEDLSVKVKYTLGVIVKVDAKQMEQIGCTGVDALIINSVVGAKEESTSLVQFVGVKKRFFAGKFYCVDYEFTYADIMLFDDIIIERLKLFDNTFEIAVD